MTSLIVPVASAVGVTVAAQQVTVQSSTLSSLSSSSSSSSSFSSSSYSSYSSSSGPIKVMVRATPLPVDRLHTLLRQHISSISSASIEDNNDSSSISNSSCTISSSTTSNSTNISKLSDLVAEAPVPPTVLLAYDPIYNLASFGGTSFHCELRSKPLTDCCPDKSNNSDSATNLRVSPYLESNKRILVVTSNEIIECSIVEDRGTCSTVRVISNRELMDLISIKSMKCKEKSGFLGFYDVLLVYRSGWKLEYRLENAKYLIELISLNLSAKGVDSHARKQNNPYLVTAESYMHRVDASMQQFDNRALEAKPPTTKAEDDERSIELIERIMNILREATENFACLSDGNSARYEEVIARMKAFLSRHDVIKLLDDSHARRKSSGKSKSQQQEQEQELKQQQQLHEQRRQYLPQVRARLVQNTTFRQVIVASNGEKDLQCNIKNASTDNDDGNVRIDSSHSYPLVSSKFIIEEENFSDSDSDGDTFVDINMDVDESISKLMRSFSASSSSSSEAINLDKMSTTFKSPLPLSSKREEFSIDEIKYMMASKSFIDES